MLALAHGMLPLSAQDATQSTPPASQQQPPQASVTPQRAAAEAEMAQLYQELRELTSAGKSAEAVELARRTLARAEALFEPTDGYVGISAGNLGHALRRVGKPAEAAPYHLRSLEVVSRYFGPDHERYKRGVAEVAEAWLLAKEGDKAIQLYRHVLAAADPPGATGTVTGAHYRHEHALALRRLGRLAPALDELQRAAELRERLLGLQHFDTINTLTLTAGILRQTSRFAEAEQIYLRALEATKALKGERDANVGILLDNLGFVYNELGRRGDAERVQREAIAIFEERLGPEHPTTAQGLANMAELYRGQGRGEEALPLFLRALAIFRTKLDPRDDRIGITLDNLASLYRVLGRFELSRATRKDALESLLRVLPETHPTVATALNNAALAEFEAGNRAGAEPLYRRAIAAQEATFGPTHHGLAIALGNLGDVLLEQGRLEEAREALTRSIAIGEETMGASHPSLAWPLHLLARIASRQGQHARALELSRRSVSLEVAARTLARLRPDSASSEPRSAAIGGALDILWAAVEAGSVEASAVLEESFQIAQRLTATVAGQSLAKLGARLGAKSPELATLVREHQDLAGQWRDADGRLVAALSLPPERRNAEAIGALRRRLAEIEHRTSTIDVQLADRHPQFATLNDPGPLGLGAVQAVLQANEALILYVVERSSIYALVITPGSGRWLRLAALASDVGRLVQTLRCGLDEGEWASPSRAQRCRVLTGREPERHLLPFDTEAAARLYDAVWRPLEADVAGRGIVMVPSGPLTSLPFQVLLAEAPVGPGVQHLAAARWLGRAHALTVLPSAGSLAVLRREAGASRAAEPYLGIANPLLLGADGTDRSAWSALACTMPGPAQIAATTTGSGSLMRSGAIDATRVGLLEPLPETTLEVCRVARSTGADASALLIGEAASERRIRELDAGNGLARYRVLHFATHGLVSGDIAGLAEPALVLTPPDKASGDDDGLLTSSEIAGLKLDADWVILSACNTAAGDKLGAEPLSGLARAFFYAGARSLLVSHWPVRSDAAVRLTTRALEDLRADPRLGRSEALRRATLALIEDGTDPTLAHPQVWAPFVVVGEGASSAAASADAAAAVPASLPAMAPVAPPTSLRAAPAPRKAERRRKPATAAPAPATEWRAPAFTSQ